MCGGTADAGAPVGNRPNWAGVRWRRRRRSTRRRFPLIATATEELPPARAQSPTGGTTASVASRAVAEVAGAPVAVAAVVTTATR
jgi:hypothetical protein